MSAVVAVLGLGEAGSRYAADLLAAGCAVRGYDPVAPHGTAGLSSLRRVASPAEAVAGADVVLSLNAASVAEQVAREASPGLDTEAVFADLNTASPQAKRRVAEVLAGSGACFTDVAVLAPVPRAGLRTPLVLAGPGRGKLARFLVPLGVPVEDAGPDPGAAAERKLLRSVFMKGLAAVVLESLDVAARAGQRDWLRAQIVAEFRGAGESLVTRLVEGTHQHAARRLVEMRAAGEHAAELGAPDDVVRAVIAWLERLTGGQAQDPQKRAHVPAGSHPDEPSR